MKKKLFGALAVVVAAFSLASCGNKTELLRRTDENQVAAAKSKITGLDTLATGTNLYTKEDGATTYYEIKVSSDIKSTLFVNTVDLAPIYKEHGQKARELTVTPLMFYSDEKNPITDNEKSTILSTVFAKDNAVSKASLGFEANYGTKWGKTVSLVDEYKNYTSSTSYSNKLAIVYMPTHVTYYEKDVEYISIYVMVPLYTEICSYQDGKASSTAISAYAQGSLVFDGLYLA